ncbi:ABC transporter permease [Agromyces atrinae]|uniref:ABC transporter permease n=1 Tax=Agromyces atrinae TaxID=592376 RepID=UPI001F586C65|nr:ABC transporter permease [Agromyces atrinae]MCI2958574.1 ABC transporter permease [Agromyces atrinae]
MTAGRRLVFGAAVLVLGVLVTMALWPTLFTSVDPLRTDPANAFLPPSSEHLFGTDQSGRDVFSRVVHGAQYSLGVGFGATTIAVVVGLVIGALSALAPRAVDGAIMRGTDILLAFPEFLIALVVIAILGPGPVNVAVAVTIGAIPVYLRLARAETRTQLTADHVEAARLLGIGPARVLTRHVLPATASPLLVLATIGIGTAIIAAAGLSFLGLGPTEPTPEWGLILSGGRNFLGRAWWIAVFPGLAITATVISATIIGRTLRARTEGRDGS